MVSPSTTVSGSESQAFHQASGDCQIAGHLGSANRSKASHINAVLMLRMLNTERLNAAAAIQLPMKIQKLRWMMVQ